MSGKMASRVDRVFLCTAVLLLICEAVNVRSRILKGSQVCQIEVSRRKQGCCGSHGCSHRGGRKMVTQLCLLTSLKIHFDVK